MGSIYDAFQVDSETVESGRWIRIEINGDYVCAIKCRPSDGDISPRYQRGVTEAVENSDELPDGKDTKMIKVLPKVYAEQVVVDWRDVNDAAGPMACTPANVERVLMDLPKLMTELHAQARDWTAFRAVQSDTVVENLKKSSTEDSTDQKSSGNGSRKPQKNSESARQST
jgi:hypothetical protein